MTSAFPQGWLARNLQASYAARVSALSLNENLVAVAVTPSSPGRPAYVSLEPSSSGILLVGSVRTVSGRRARLSFHKQGDGTITVAGTIGSGAGTRKYVYVVEDPASFATGAFRNALITRGIAVDGASRLGQTPAAATKLASLKSPPLFSMIAAMNRESINHYAELLFRDAARSSARRDRKRGEQLHILQSFFADKVGADPTGLYFADGSGSVHTRSRYSARDDAVTRLRPQIFGDRGCTRPSPSPENSELLRRRMRNTPAEGNLHAKKRERPTRSSVSPAMSPLPTEKFWPLPFCTMAWTGGARNR